MMIDLEVDTTGVDYEKDKSESKDNNPEKEGHDF